MIEISITINNKKFSAKLHNNLTTQSLIKEFPLDLNMIELNGNEKYYRLQHTFPTATEKIGMIKAGDIMLYGNDCLVVFYETFSSSYQYTRLGHIDDVVGLSRAVGTGSARIVFNLADE
ncbi:cyclophilin-like fold protein [Dehalobacter restrictus]|uniref:cyclophilin-like fold protein n=1 Tax=Dehalobacter restrictus TaxID=55583 RepID=UPI00338E0965